MAAIEQISKAGLTAAEKGVLYAVLAHLTWGAMAVYFGFMIHISPVEIAVHRGLWSIPFAGVIIWWLGQYRDVWQAVLSKRNLAIFTLTSSIIVFNWGFYVWSIEQGRALESSLGYYINPLLNVVMGYLFLGERFNRLQLLALLLALIAVLIQTFAAGVFPWLGLMLATTFCLYGFLRKTIAVGPTQGFFIEVCIIAIPLLLMQFWLAGRGEAHFGGAISDTLLLMGCGLMTTTALVFFALSIKLLRYSTAGLLQYISPTLVFLTAVFVFGEPMDKWKLLSFVVLWIGLAIYSWSALRDERSRRREAETLV
ncbi:MAG: EamA family transporter RarD [Hyphomicrobiales bacterium]|nr:EamA family transporter RarD [Hyphomicrobiales bacterium]